MYKQVFLISAIILSSIALSIYPDLVRVLRTPVNHTFPLIHNSSNNAHQDYFYYLSFIRQGYDGRWLLTSRMTAENFPPKLAYTFFAALGHLGRITNISAPWIYFLSRIVLGIALLSVCVFIGGKLYKTKFEKILLTVFLGFATGFWYYKSGMLIQFFTFWTRFDPLLRTTFLPHHLFSTILGVLSLYYFSRGLGAGNIKHVVRAGFLGMLSGFVFYSTMINILGGIALVMLVRTLWYFKTNTNFGLFELAHLEGVPASPAGGHSATFQVLRSDSWKVKFIKTISLYDLRAKFVSKTLKESIIEAVKMNKLFFIYAALSSSSLIYLYFLSQSTFPWNSYQNLGQSFNYGAPFMEYVLALGPVFILTLIGIPRLIKTKSQLSFLLLGWSFFPFVGFYLLNKLLPTFSNMIYLEATSYIPLSILAIYGIQNLYRYLPQHLIILLLAITMLYFIPPLASSLNNELTKLPVNYYNIYLPNSLLDGFNWLNNNTPKESVVLGGTLLGNIIPAYTSNKVVFGHPVDTYQADEKSRDVLIFFAQKDLKKAKEILKKNNVSYVFYALDTDKPDENFLNKLGLKSRFANNNVSIYSFQ